MSHHQHQVGAFTRLTRIAQDFFAFYGLTERLQNLSNALNEDKTFERALGVIGLAGFVVIGMTL